MPIAPGARLGHYQILSPLGSGGMGEVYAAEDTKLSRKIALKVLPELMAANPDRRERFEREARAIAALNHPNIVTIHSVEESAGVPFITMELVEGKTLSEVIPRHGLPLDKLLKLAIPLADAISAAHQRGITHRDLKPTNIMVGDDGRLKVLDFGLAKLKEEALLPAGATALPTQELTGEGRIVGTVAYMSPEQAEGRSLDHRSDIFSLGIMLYEIATGQRPFKGETQVSMLSSIIKDTPAAVTDLNQTLPRELGRIIRRALVKDPEHRYQSAKDLRNELEELKQESDSGELQAAAVAPGAAARPGRRWLIAAGIVTVTVIIAGALWLRPALAPERLITVPLEATFTQLTSQSGAERWTSLSPDGRWFIYGSAASGNQDIYLQSVGGQMPINLTKDSPDDDMQPAFSPDGERIAFRSTRSGGGIFVMGRTGESVRRLADAGFNPAWSPEGNEVVFATGNGSNPYGRDEFSELWVVTIATGQKRRISQADAVQPCWSPHGHRIAYWALPKQGSRRDIWTIPAGGGTPIAVTNDAAIDWNPIWSPDGSHLYFSSDRGGSLNLWRVPIDEQSGRVLGPPQPVTAPSPEVRDVSISADGRRLVYASILTTTHVQKLSFDSATGAIKGDPLPITSGSRSFGDPDPSSDGQWVAFYSLIQQEDIFLSRPDGTGLRQLTNDAAKDRGPRWSPDGSRIAFYSDRGGAYNIWTIKPDGSGLEQLTGASETSLLYPVWSPDGSKMAVTELTAGFSVHILDPSKSWAEQHGQTLPPFLEAGRQFSASSWSPDGQELAGERTLRQGIVVYSLTSKSYEKLTDSGQDPVWLSDSQRLLFIDRGKLFILDRKSKAVRELLALPGNTIGGMTLSRDNRQIYFARLNPEADIWMATIKGNKD